jgi:uncharacterized phiE125 gp8 family phage protein
VATSVTLYEVKAHLNITNQTSDAELYAFIDAAEAAIEKRTGPIVARAVTARVSGAMTLPVYPAISLTSVTPYASTALDVSTLYVSPAGVVDYLSGGGSFPARDYTITYLAGWATTAADVPADLRLAVLEMVRVLWSTTQRGSTARPGSAPPPDAAPFAGPGMDRVEQLIAPYEMHGFA